MEEQQQQINSERDSLQRREQEILAKMEAEHKKEEERLQKILEEIKNAVSANADTSFLNEMPSWISPLMEKMQSFMKTFDSPIMQILMGALSKLINETLEKFSSQKAEPDNNISKSVGTHSD